MERNLKSWLHVTGEGKQGLTGFSLVRMADTSIGQLADPGEAAQLEGRLIGASRGPAEGMRCPLLTREVLYVSERRADEGAITGTANEG